MARNLFSEPEVEPDVSIRGITIAEVMEALRMHKHSVLGLGGKPGFRRARLRPRKWWPPSANG